MWVSEIGHLGQTHLLCLPGSGSIRVQVWMLVVMSLAPCVRDDETSHGGCVHGFSCLRGGTGVSEMAPDTSSGCVSFQETATDISHVLLVQPFQSSPDHMSVTIVLG